MNVGETKFVDYLAYCGTCKHKDDDESTEPCNECLSTPTNVYSHKPTKYEEKK